MDPSPPPPSPPCSSYNPRLKSHRLLRADVKAGKRKRDLWEDHVNTMAKYRHLYSDIVAAEAPKREEPLEVTLLIGPTGTGKTKFVYDKYSGNPEFYRAPLSNGTMWWDRYDQHKKVLIDDFCGSSSHMTLLFLLQLLDIYSVDVPIKGGYTPWLPTEIYLTTNIHPKDWYTWKDRGEHYLALARRFNTVRVFSKHSDCVEYTGDEKDKWFKDNCPDEALDQYPIPVLETPSSPSTFHGYGMASAPQPKKKTTTYSFGRPVPSLYGDPPDQGRVPCNRDGTPILSSLYPD